MRLQKIRDISKQVNIDVQTQRVLRCLAVFLYSSVLASGEMEEIVVKEKTNRTLGKFFEQ